MSIHDHPKFGEKADQTDRHDQEVTADVIPLRRSAGEDQKEDRPGPVTAGEPVQRSPIIPDFLRRDQIGTVAKYWFGLTFYRVRFHAVRTPAYLGRTGWYALRGLVDLINAVMRWWHWTNGWTLESLAVAAGRSGHHDAMNAHREGKRTRGTRGRILAVAVVAALVLLVVAGIWLPGWAWPLLGMAAVVVLARRGRPEGRSIVGTAVVPTAYQPPTAESVTTAFASLGIKAINDVIKDGTGLHWIADIHRDGDGWGLELDLPHGVTASEIIKKREALASGLRRPHSATWPEKVPHEHAGRLFLWIGRHDISKVKPAKYPLLKSGTTDVFDQVPFAATPRGVGVDVPLYETNWLIGAAPGQGKTAAVRVLACDAALDPICDLWIHELAGKEDLDPLGQVCHRYVSGMDDDAIAYTAESVRLLKADLQQRQKAFKKVPRERKPDGKVTREVALDPKYKALRPKLVIFDEIQNLFLHPKYGPQVADDLADVKRLGRAYGIIILDSTQRPDKDSLPPKYGALAVMRFCLKVNDQVSNDMVLGTGAYKAGYAASEFRHEVDAGLGWLKGAADPQAVRTYYLNLNDTAKVAARARAMREAQGVLSGYALGEVDDTEQRNFASDVLAMFRTDEHNLHTATLAARLSEHLAGVYGDVTQDAVASQLRQLGVEIKDVRERGGTNRKGVSRAGVEAVTAATGVADASGDGVAGPGGERDV